MTFDPNSVSAKRDALDFEPEPLFPACVATESDPAPGRDHTVPR